MHPEGEPVAAGVVCHAHPLHGGVMHFKVVFRAAKALQQNGVAALRFNFRGVGRSQGEHDHGVGEQDDAAAALDELERRFRGLPLVLGGFSFGAATALHLVARDPRPRAVFALGFPRSLMPESEALAEIRIPRLFVQGERDEFASGAELGELVSALPGHPRLDVVPGADHFFTGQLERVQQTLSDWIASRPWQEAS
jgi:alpha/beta superfamily hydrolase